VSARRPMSAMVSNAVPATRLRTAAPHSSLHGDFAPAILSGTAWGAYFGPDCPVIALPQATRAQSDSCLRKPHGSRCVRASSSRSVHGPRPPRHSETFDHPDVAVVDAALFQPRPAVCRARRCIGRGEETSDGCVTSPLWDGAITLPPRWKPSCCPLGGQCCINESLTPKFNVRIVIGWRRAFSC